MINHHHRRRHYRHKSSIITYLEELFAMSRAVEQLLHRRQTEVITRI